MESITRGQVSQKRVQAQTNVHTRLSAANGVQIKQQQVEIESQQKDSSNYKGSALWRPQVEAHYAMAQIRHSSDSEEPKLLESMQEQIAGLCNLKYAHINSEDDDKGSLSDDLDTISFTSSVSVVPESNIDEDCIYARYAFNASLEGQVSVVKNEPLKLLDNSHGYWWLVRTLTQDKAGYIPAEYVELPIERLARLNKHRNVGGAVLKEIMQGSSTIQRSFRGRPKGKLLPRDAAGRCVKFERPTFIDPGPNSILTSESMGSLGTDAFPEQLKMLTVEDIEVPLGSQDPKRKSEAVQDLAAVHQTPFSEEDARKRWEENEEEYQLFLKMAKRRSEEATENLIEMISEETKKNISKLADKVMTERNAKKNFKDIARRSLQEPFHRSCCDGNISRNSKETRTQSSNDNYGDVHKHKQPSIIKRILLIAWLRQKLSKSSSNSSKSKKKRNKNAKRIKPAKPKDPQDDLDTDVQLEFAKISSEASVTENTNKDQNGSRAAHADTIGIKLIGISEKSSNEARKGNIPLSPVCHNRTVPHGNEVGISQTNFNSLPRNSTGVSLESERSNQASDRVDTRKQKADPAMITGKENESDLPTKSAVADQTNVVKLTQETRSVGNDVNKTRNEVTELQLSHQALASQSPDVSVDLNFSVSDTFRKISEDQNSIQDTPSKSSNKESLQTNKWPFENFCVKRKEPKDQYWIKQTLTKNASEPGYERNVRREKGPDNADLLQSNNPFLKRINTEEKGGIRDQHCSTVVNTNEAFNQQVTIDETDYCSQDEPQSQTESKLELDISPLKELSFEESKSKDAKTNSGPSGDNFDHPETEHIEEAGNVVTYSSSGYYSNLEVALVGKSLTGLGSPRFPRGKPDAETSTSPAEGLEHDKSSSERAKAGEPRRKTKPELVATQVPIIAPVKIETNSATGLEVGTDPTPKLRGSGTTEPNLVSSYEPTEKSNLGLDSICDSTLFDEITNWNASEFTKLLTLDFAKYQLEPLVKGSTSEVDANKTDSLHVIEGDEIVSSTELANTIDKAALSNAEKKNEGRKADTYFPVAPVPKERILDSDEKTMTPPKTKNAPKELPASKKDCGDSLAVELGCIEKTVSKDNIKKTAADNPETSKFIEWLDNEKNLSNLVVRIRHSSHMCRRQQILRSLRSESDSIRTLKSFEHDYETSDTWKRLFASLDDLLIDPSSVKSIA